MLLMKRLSGSSVLTENIKSVYSLFRGKKVMMSSNTEGRVGVILELSPEEKKKKELIETEMRFEKESGNHFIPDTISAESWKKLLRMESPIRRNHYYRYLKLNEKEEKNKIRRIRKAIKRKTMIKDTINKNPNHIEYGLHKNTIIFKVRKRAMNHFYNCNLAHALMFGQKLVIDLGYEDKMDWIEMKDCIKQIAFYHGFNKRSKEPFHLNLCNANMNGDFMCKLCCFLPFLGEPNPLINVTEKSYLDLFPKNKLVYLTPYCDEDLVTYSHDDIYIVGGIVDKNRQGHVSLEKAKRESLRMARLPLRKYLSCDHNPKTVLTIDIVLKILFTMKETMDWSKALKYVPRKRLNNAFKEGLF